MSADRSPPFLDAVRRALRVRHYSIRTERALSGMGPVLHPVSRKTPPGG